MSRPSMPSASFTDAERAVLARYVTNLDGPVFGLTQLPEVIKGALFSRYSRSPKGLRELLLREFIQDPDAAFGEIGGETAPDTSGQHLAVERAQRFYDRILDGYGDDSIGELGGAHLACEDVSMLAAKALEDARIGGSPLEKSTRYVSFAEKRDGEWLFYQEPTLLSSKHRTAYLGICRGLFEAYAEMVPQLTTWLEQRVPRDPNGSEAAWRRAVRARAYDGLRGLLPAATLTNVGLFGNGRFFESLLVRLQTEPLAELSTLGAQMHGELAKVIPSFVRRAAPGHAHFAGFKRHADALRALPARIAGPAGNPGVGAVQVPGTGCDLTLLHVEPDAEARLLGALAYPGSAEPLHQLTQRMAGLRAEERARLIAGLADVRENRRHKPPRAAELIFYGFDLLGDYGMYRDLHRHRMLTQQRQPLSTRHGYVMPVDVEDAGLAGRYHEMMERAAEVYEQIAPELPHEAQYAVPMAYRIRWHLHVNLRALIWLVELRSSPQGHPAYRAMAQQLYQAVADAHPAFAPLFKFVDLSEPELGRLAAEERQARKQAGQ